MEPDVLAASGSAVPTEVEARPVSHGTAVSSSLETSMAPKPAALAPYVHGNGNGNGVNGARKHALGTIARRLEERGVWVRAERSASWARGPARLAISRPESVYLRRGKRVLDLLGATLALVIGAPILLLAAIAIKLESRGPVFYRSTRIGRDGRPFTFFKLRSMVNGADLKRHDLKHLNQADGPVFKIFADPRVTRVGRWLRSTSIDELPQLFHVLSGEMSMVGPRPPLPEEVKQYEPWQLHRLDVRPGLTCLWQISGRSRIGFDEWMRLDLEYIRNQSLLLDLTILLRTIPAVLSREGAY
jgi:lipopolysaccharide/colanic/teichoic acid biosynthesis glycosyltransferase